MTEVRAPSDLAARIRALPAGAVRLEVPGLAKDLWPYQANDVAWLLAQKQALIGHEVGTGKTVFAIAMAAYLKSKGDFGGMVVLCPSQAGELLAQWALELALWAPSLRVTVTGGGVSKRDRLRAYRESWDVLVVNYESARNDVPELLTMIERRNPTLLYCDEASLFRHASSKIGRMVRAIASRFPYRFAVTGTPIEMGVEDLWGIMACMGWEDVVGSQAWFMRQYTERELVEFYARGGRKMRRLVVTGYQNLGDLRRRIEPWHIRRTLNDPEVARHIPEVQTMVLRPRMTRAQAAAYVALRDGIVARMNNGEIELTQDGVKASWIRLLGASDGLRTLDPDMPDESGKADWLIEALQGQFAHEKVLVFSRFVRSVRVLEDRLRAAGINYARFVGTSHQSPAERVEDVRRFKEDPTCRVMLATSAVERGLNLQVARVVVFFGIVSNPARLEQIMGRIRRGGSPHASVVAVTLLARGTVEEPLYEKVLQRNAVKDFVWEEESVLFERLGPREIAAMIRS